MKNFFTLLVLSVLAVSLGYGQCSLYEVPLNNRINQATVIVEGNVVAQKSFWDDLQHNIYTATKIEVYRVFKGNVTSQYIEVITPGGTVGLHKEVVEPSLELEAGQKGVFFFRNNQVSLNSIPFTTSLQLEPLASVQGFVKYDFNSGTAKDPFHEYTDVENDLHQRITNALGTSANVLQPYSFEQEYLQKQNTQRGGTPNITNFSPTTVTAGTQTQITINGSNFGSTQGGGVVRFANADDGGATNVEPLATEYVSWSDNQIVVEVTQDAGTGTIQVVQGGTATSGATLTISYAELNAIFDQGSGDEAWPTQHIDRNGNGGYVWQMFTDFDANTAAKESFNRAFESWRCTTGIYWEIGATTTTDIVANDDINIIRHDNGGELPGGVLGRCTSRWSGCFGGGGTVDWYVEELDIVFDDGTNWQYGPTLPGLTEYDFETVAVHELGHGHQLGHVINPGAIMHFAIGNGSSNRTLGVNDIAGGNDVQTRSTTTTVCGETALSTYNCGSAPVADFSASSTTICEGGSINFTDLSTNTPTSWSWTFNGGTPNSSSDQNPGGIVFNTAGTYTIELTATNGSGNDTETKIGYITVHDAPNTSASQINASCNGASDGSIDLTVTGGTSPYTFSWAHGPTTEDVTGLVAGTYNVTVTDANTCQAMAGFTITEPAAIDLTNTSSTDETCALNDGTATVTPSGGTSPYSYSWNTIPVQTNATATGLAAGTYTVTVIDVSGCFNQTNVTVNYNCIPGTKLRAFDCGSTLPTFDKYFYADKVTDATAYEWELTDTDDQSVYTYINTVNHSAYMSLFSGTTYGKTYEVRVRARVGGVWGSYGVMCFLSTPAATVQNTKLRNFDCNSTLSTFDRYFYCDPITGATAYEFQLVDQDDFQVYTYINTVNNSARMTNIPGTSYGKTYDVAVRAQVGGIWGQFDIICQLSTPAFPTTQLRSADCNTTLSTPSQVFYAQKITGANNYEFEFTDQGTLAQETYVKNNPYQSMLITLLTNWDYGTTYDVRVRAQIGSVWGSFGPVCTITTPTQNFWEQGEESAHKNLVDSNNDAIPTSITLAPNPSDGNNVLLKIDRIKNEYSTIQIDVYDIYGKQVYGESVVNRGSAMSVMMNFNEKLTSGIYILNTTINGESISQKMIIK